MPQPSKFKLQVLSVCQSLLEEKVARLRSVLKEATEAGNAETKSTAGDKHETGRAMMQLEQEKLGNQLYELELQQKEFNQIDATKQITQVSPGALFETEKGLFFIAIALGKIEVDAKSVFVISSRSPVALALMGLKEKESRMFNDVTYTIQSLC